MLFSLISTALAAAVSLSISSLAAPLAGRAPLTVSQILGPVIDGEYIVKLKDNANTANHIASLPFAFIAGDPASPIKHQYSDDFFKGYSGAFSDSDLVAILASPDVEFVEPNGVVTTMTNNGQQPGSPWGLQSISTRTPVGGNDAQSLGYTYYYNGPLGNNVNIYIIDTGVKIDHSEFEGRASFGFAAPGYEKNDGNGHGTHCAGIAAGKTFGVAKHACIVAVKVLGDDGSGSIDNVIAGVEWVIKDAQSNHKQPVASMSLGGSVSKALDAAVRKAIAKDITFAVAAGNDNMDADLTSPARVREAITVAASDIQNKKASFSNWGLPVDIFAPGVDVTSAWIGSNDAVNTISGTSMATPHVAGLCAYILSINPGMTPAALAEKVRSLGTKDVLSDVPPLTPNLLAYNGGLEGPNGSSTSGSGTSGILPGLNLPNVVPSVKGLLSH